MELRVILKEGYGNMDWAAVTAMLATAHWCRGIGEDEVRKGAKNSALNGGAFEGERQTGYLRVISDKTRFAYILDVFVHPGSRGRGVAKSMVEYALAHAEFADVTRWTLITGSAHGLYEKCGFAPTARPDDWMELHRERKRR